MSERSLSETVNEEEEAAIIKLTMRALKEYYGLNPGKYANAAKGIGYQLGFELAGLMKSTQFNELIEELSSFWRRNGIGEMEWMDKDRNILKIEECSDCLGRGYGAGYPLCPAKEGIIEGLLFKKLKERYLAEEIECCGTLAPNCLFLIKKRA